MKFPFVRTAAAIVMLCLAAAPALAQDTVAGDWDLSLETPQGAQVVNVSLKLDADKLTGQLSSPVGSVPLTGTVKGADSDFTANIDAQGMQLPLNFHGTLAGATFNGTVKVGDFGEFPFTGTRAAAAAAAPAASAAAPPAAATGAPVDMSGKWAITLSIQGLGEFPAIADVKQQGAELTGTMATTAAPDATVPLEGTVTGNTLRIDFTAQTPQGPIPITITGELGGTGLAGKAIVAGGMAEATWKGTRQ
jgi:hypothetical protein